MKLPKIFVLDRDLEGKTKEFLEEMGQSAEPEYGKFEVVETGIYAESIAELKKRKQKLFTFADNVEARVIDYGANGEDAMLFKTWLDSVTGIAYKAKSTKFKLILRSDKLENIPKGFNQSFMPIDYNAEKGIELDSKKGKYNQSLTREEAKNHEFWLAVMNGDREKLARYVDLWFDKTGEDKGMGVYLRSNTNQDELRALVLYFDFNYSSTDGDFSLYDSVRFVSGAQQK